MTQHVIKVPWRYTIRERADGTKDIVLSINGRTELVLRYDPRTNALTEVQPTEPDLETKC